MEDETHNPYFSRDHLNYTLTISAPAQTTTISNSNPQTLMTVENNNSGVGGGVGESVRSRWSPKPEQILILESIFNSGIVNPPKDETIRIRKIIEKFGAVGDANVFYWFQNRRSRSRRRQRQLQSAVAVSSVTSPVRPSVHITGGAGHTQMLSGCSSNSIALGSTLGLDNNNIEYNDSNNILLCSSSHGSQLASGSPCDCLFSSLVSGSGINDGYLFSLPQLLHPQPLYTIPTLGPSAPPVLSPVMSPMDNPNLSFQSLAGGGGGVVITVFVNGVATQVPAGPLDLKAMFGSDVILVHQTGIPVPFDDFGISLQSLQHGDNYFLVPRLA